MVNATCTTSQNEGVKMTIVPGICLFVELGGETVIYIAILKRDQQDLPPLVKKIDDVVSVTCTTSQKEGVKVTIVPIICFCCRTWGGGDCHLHTITRKEAGKGHDCPRPSLCWNRGGVWPDHLHTTKRKGEVKVDTCQTLLFS